MTVYNITKLSPNTAKAIAKYYGVDKVSLRYSDFLNTFGAVPKNKLEAPNISAHKRAIVKRYLNKKFRDIPDKVLKSYPRIETRKVK